MYQVSVYYMAANSSIIGLHASGFVQAVALAKDIVRRGGGRMVRISSATTTWTFAIGQVVSCRTCRRLPK